MGKDKEISPEPVTRTFRVPDIGHEELVAIHIMTELLGQFDHCTQHRVLDYLKSRCNVSEVRIIESEDQY